MAVVTPVDVNNHLLVRKWDASNSGGELSPGLLLKRTIPPQDAVEIENNACKSHFLISLARLSLLRLAAATQARSSATHYSRLFQLNIV